MADNEKEIIKQIEAEFGNEKNIPKSSSRKRSAFINRSRLANWPDITDCNPVVSLGNYSAGWDILDVSTGQTQNIMAPPWLFNHVASGNGDIAKWGNKIYVGDDYGGVPLFPGEPNLASQTGMQHD